MVFVFDDGNADEQQQEQDVCVIVEFDGFEVVLAVLVEMFQVMRPFSVFYVTMNQSPLLLHDCTVSWNFMNTNVPPEGYCTVNTDKTR